MASPFEKLLNFKSFNLFQRRANSVIGIDVGTSSIKVVQLRREKGRAILETYGEIATGPYRSLAVGQVAIVPPEKMVEVTRDLFKEANVTTTLGSLSIPLGSSLVTIIEIPKVSRDLLPKVIPIEARKYIPVPISEVALDWWVLPSEGGGSEASENKLQVLVVAIHNTIISQHQEFAKQMGIQPAFFEIETFSAIRSVFGGEMNATVMLDIGASNTKMAIVDYGIVRSSHTIPKGSQDITLALSRSLGVDFAKAEEIKRTVGLVEHYDGRNVSVTVNSIVEFIFSEVSKVISRYQEKNRRSVNKIVLIGGGALLRGLVEVAGKNFEIPVTLGKPFEMVAAPAFLTPILGEAGPGFAVAIGLALRHLQTLD